AADLAIWLWTILFRGASGRPYNVGSSENLSIKQTADAVNRVCDNTLAVHVAQQATPGKAIARYVPSVERAQRELHLLQRVSIEESIRKTIEWNRHHLDAR
ncbi:MAG: epimerase, partial [Verrucomicrobiales bacterium]|nr:epimerase [Verrucomicrobiales bacterium]